MGLAGFELPRVTNFLFCCSLNFGALFIGYFSLVIAIAYISASSCYIYLVALYVQQNKDGTLHDPSPEDLDSNALRLYIIYGLQLFNFIFNFIISLMLIIGAHKRQTRYMRYYYMAGLMNLVMDLAVITASFVLYGYPSIVSQLLTCGVLFYFLLVVRSAFLEMEKKAQLPDYEKKLLKPTQQTPQLVYK